MFFFINKSIIKIFLTSKKLFIHNIAFLSEEVVSISAILWIMDWYFGQKFQFKVRPPWWWICFLQKCRFSLHKTFIYGLEWCGLKIDYCDVFISCLDFNSDGTHSLQWIIDEQVMQSYIFSNLFWWRNKLTYTLDGLPLILGIELFL